MVSLAYIANIRADAERVGPRSDGIKTRVSEREALLYMLAAYDDILIEFKKLINACHYDDDWHGLTRCPRPEEISAAIRALPRPK